MRVTQEFPTNQKNASNMIPPPKRVTKERRTRVSSKSAPQECQIKVSKSVPQKCQISVSYNKRVLQSACLTISVSYKSVKFERLRTSVM